MSIHVVPELGVEVVVPMRCRPAEVADFVSRNRKWISDARREIAPLVPPPPRTLPAHIALRSIEETYELRFGTSGLKRGWRETRDGFLDLACEQDEVYRGQRILRHWLQNKGRRVLVPWLNDTARITGLNYKQVHVRGQRTRWGSYSTSGTLCVNFCLLFLPADLVRYLFVHELCHTEVFNHTRRYWRLVESIEPNYKAQEERLNEARPYLPGWLII